MLTLLFLLKNIKLSEVGNTNTMPKPSEKCLDRIYFPAQISLLTRDCDDRLVQSFHLVYQCKTVIQSFYIRHINAHLDAI